MAPSSRGSVSPRPGRQRKPQHRPPPGAAAGSRFRQADIPRSPPRTPICLARPSGLRGDLNPEQDPSPVVRVPLLVLGLKLRHRSDSGGSWSRRAGCRVPGAPRAVAQPQGDRARGSALAVSRLQAEGWPLSYGDGDEERVPRAKAECVSRAVGGSASPGAQPRLTRGTGPRGGQTGCSCPRG